MSAVAAGYAVLSVMQHENWVSLVFTKKGEAAPPKYCLCSASSWVNIYASDVDSYIQLLKLTLTIASQTDCSESLRSRFHTWGEMLKQL